MGFNAMCVDNVPLQAVYDDIAGGRGFFVGDKFVATHAPNCDDSEVARLFSSPEARILYGSRSRRRTDSSTMSRWTKKSARCGERVPGSCNFCRSAVL